VPVVEYADYVDSLRASRPELAAELYPFRGLGKVMQWMAARGIPLESAEIIHQDEFSLDFVFQLEVDGTHLAFGIT
jgi:hypothetical protein